MKKLAFVVLSTIVLTRVAVANTVELGPVSVTAEKIPTVLEEPVEDVENSVVMQETVNGFEQPIIHGMMGDSIFLTVDGIKFSNSLFRSGPNQYYSWIPSDFITDAKLNNRLSELSSASLGGSIDRTLGVKESKVSVSTNLRDHKEVVNYKGKHFSFSLLNDNRKNVVTPNGEVAHSAYNQKGALLTYKQDSGDETKFVHTQSNDVDRTDKFEKGDYYVYELQQYDLISHKINIGKTFAIIPSYQRFEEKINRHSPDSKDVHSINNMYGLSVLGRYDIPSIDDAYITYGASDTFEDIKYKKGNDTNYYNYNTLSAYITYNDVIGDDFMYSALYKYSKLDVSGNGLDTNLDNHAFGLRGEYLIGDDSSIFVNTSLNYKFPTITNLAEAKDDSVSEIANPNLKQEKAYTIEVGYEYDRLRITGFYKKLYDIIIREETTIPDGSGGFMWQYQNANEGFVKGINVKYDKVYKNGFGVYLFAEYMEGKTDYDYLSKRTPFRSIVKISQKVNWIDKDKISMTWKYAPKVPESKMSEQDKTDIRIKDHNYGYNIVNLGYQTEIKKRQVVSVDINNVFNKTGRVYGSSTDFAERHVNISYTYKF